MRVFLRHLPVAAAATLFVAGSSLAQKVLTWQEVKNRFEAANPSLRAGQISVEESHAQEIFAYLRPNPDLTLLSDGTQIAPYNGVWQPLAGTMVSTNISYLHERQRKRELRLESAQDATKIATSGQSDLERTLIFDLRNAFIQMLQQQAVLKLAKDNLSYYDHVLDANRERYKAGAISRVDLDRLELQHVQYESDVQNAHVGLRTAKLQLLALLNDRTPVEQFDVTGPFDFAPQIASLEDVRQTAVDTRPDLRAVAQSVEKAKADHRLAIANGSTDPTIATWWSYNPSFNNPFAHQTLGASVSIPLRIFDRNQGEKLRTELEIERSGKLLEASRAQVFSDVDRAHASVESSLQLLRPYKDRYLEQALRIRDTIAFSYEHGAASLLDFLNAQADYRSVQLAYLNLIASYLTAANQLNLAVGRDVIQ
jgi:outer membrane protein, heavy metal efflux system